MFDQENPIVQLCAQGIQSEATDRDEARGLYQRAWDSAQNDFERFVAAHYLARVQDTIEEKLVWDNVAIKHALQVDDPQVRGSFASLYLNIGKGYEELRDFAHARDNYQLAADFTEFLTADPYGDMIRKGVAAGLKRVDTL